MVAPITHSALTPPNTSSAQVDFFFFFAAIAQRSSEDNLRLQPHFNPKMMSSILVWPDYHIAFIWVSSDPAWDLAEGWGFVCVHVLVPASCTSELLLPYEGLQIALCSLRSPQTCSLPRNQQQCSPSHFIPLPFAFLKCASNSSSLRLHAWIDFFAATWLTDLFLIVLSVDLANECLICEAVCNCWWSNVYGQVLSNFHFTSFFFHLFSAFSFLVVASSKSPLFVCRQMQSQHKTKTLC